MADSPILPGSHLWKLNRQGQLPEDFWRFFRDLVTYVRQTQGNTSDLAAFEARLATLEHSGLSADILGNMSVQVLGSLAGGEVVLQLRGDSASPGASRYYGTDQEGSKGFHALPNPPPPFVPYFIPAGDEFNVPLYFQATFSMTIDVEGILDVEGYLIEVD